MTARIYGCHFDQSAHQTFIVTEKGEIVIDTVCLTVGEENRPLRYDECVHHSLDEPNEKQKFIYDKAVRIWNSILTILEFSSTNFTFSTLGWHL